MSIIQGTSKSSAAAAYEIEQSIRFNDDDDSHLYDTSFSASPTSSTVCTISVWVKRGSNLGSNSTIISAGDPAGSTYEALRFGTGNQLQFSQASSDYDLKTTQVFRDPSAWYHIVAVLNTGAAESSRAALYVNGSQVTDFATENYPSSSYSTNFTSGASGVAHVVGANGYEGSGPDSQHFDGYLAEINFVDGQALDPTSFGETNSDTGQWVPKKYTGSYGTNGFRLQGSDSSDLGEDTSGNGNDFTSSGLAAADQVPDTPTPSADSAIGNRATLMSIQDGSPTMSEGNTRFSNSGGTRIQRTTNQPLVGKTYWEVLVNNATQNTAGVSSDQISTFTNDTFYNQTTLVAGFDNANFYYNGSFTTYSQPSATQRWMFAYDADTGELWSGVNGTWHNSGNPAAGTGEVATLSTSYKWFPFIGGKSGADQQIIWGASNMSHTVPTGFTADLSSYRQSDPTIADPSAYFQTTTYTGDGSSSNEVNQAGNSTFEPSMVWIKSRSAATNHVIQDQVRGNFVLYPDLSNAQGATGGGWVSSFDSDGFTVNVNGPINASGETFVGWQWKAAGSGSSNTDGSVTSTVSNNSTSNFSIVKYTGTGSGDSTVGHGLGVTPDMILLKHLDRAQNWRVFHTSEGVGKTGFLNSTAAFSADPDRITAVSSTTFTAAANMNESADYIAYCFAEVEDFSKFTSYEGNASTDGPFIFCGFRPSFVMIKNVDAVEDWWIQDAVREPFNGGNMARISPNSSAAESDNVAWFDFVSNGLKVRYNAGGINNSGTHIVMAFAESPFKTSTAR